MHIFGHHALCQSMSPSCTFPFWASEIPHPRLNLIAAQNTFGALLFGRFASALRELGPRQPKYLVGCGMLLRARAPETIKTAKTGHGNSFTMDGKRSYGLMQARTPKIQRSSFHCRLQNIKYGDVVSNIGQTATTCTFYSTSFFPACDPTPWNLISFIPCISVAHSSGISDGARKFWDLARTSPATKSNYNSRFV